MLLFLISGFEFYNMQLQSSQEHGIITVIIYFLFLNWKATPTYLAIRGEKSIIPDCGL